MKFRSATFAVLALVALCALGRSDARADVPLAEQERVQRVFDRLLAYCDPPEGFAWPPEVAVVDVDAVNAQCFNNNEDPAGQVRPRVEIFAGIMKEIVGDDDDRLAFILGHELNHALLRHIVHTPGEAKSRTMLLRDAFTREQELAADAGGLELMVKAGYSHQGAIDAMKAMIDKGYDYSSFEGLGVNHPSWKERLALMDKQQPTLWKAMAAFHSGSDLLLLEQYPAAIKYFEAVTAEFPSCPEAYANIGYAKLMMYCDKLKQSDVLALGINQVIVGGFYQRPASLVGQVRGIDRSLWIEAVTALNKALELDSNLTLARANLGVAYLVGPDGKDVDQATRYLNAAAKQVDADKTLFPSVAASILINTGVANLSSGETADAADNFAKAESLSASSSVNHMPFGAAVTSALLYNRAAVLGASTLSDNRRQAVTFLEEYFKTADPDGAWWPQAYERYSKLCADVGQRPADELSLRSTASSRKRPISAVVVKSGVQVTLGESLDDLQKSMTEKPIRIREISGTDFLRLIYPKKGISVLGTDSVLAICLSGTDSPDLPIRGTEVGSEIKPVHCGMTIGEFEKVIGEQNISFEPLTDPNVQYVVYRDLQLAVRVENGKIAEMVVALIPESYKEEKK